MNTLNEFFFVATGITVVFSILIIVLISSNSKTKKELKESKAKLKKEIDYAEKMYQSAKNFQISFETERNIVIQQKDTIERLSDSLKFKDDLIHGYRIDLNKSKEIQNLWQIECDKLRQTHLEEEKKLKEAIEYLEQLNSESMSQVAELNQANNELEKLIDECAIYIMNHLE